MRSKSLDVTHDRPYHTEVRQLSRGVRSMCFFDVQYQFFVITPTECGETDELLRLFFFLLN